MKPEKNQGLFHYWSSVKSNAITKNVIRLFGHLNGIWTIDEYIEIGRKIPNTKGLHKILLQVRERKIGNNRALSIENFGNIGERLVLPHGIGIVINADAKIGNDCTIYQGVTIGIVDSGKRAGVPIIQDRVTIGPNAVIVGNCLIGHDSLIAGNAFVDFDVPPNSVVVGNPGIIHTRKGNNKNE